MEEFESIQIARNPKILTVTLSRPGKRNSINPILVRELEAVLEQAESNPDCRVIVLRAEGDTFCAGLDFDMVSNSPDLNEEQIRQQGEAFYRLMSRLVESRIVIVAAVDGQVSAGGIGLVCAADFVISTPRSQYSLPEALWGLVPCCVAPFLIRRVGNQKARTLALSTRSLNAEEAQKQHLVDEVASNLELAIRMLCNRLCQLQTDTLGRTKSFFNDLSIGTTFKQSDIIDQYSAVMSSPAVRKNIVRYTTEGKFPWEQ